MNKKYEDEIRNTFRDLMKEGKEVVWNYIEMAEEFYRNLDEVSEYDKSVDETLKEIRETKRFDFEQYKEIRRFLAEHQRINGLKEKYKPKEDNDYIIL